MRVLLLVVAIHIIGVQQGVASECQSDALPLSHDTMTPWQSMNHYIGYTQSIQVNVYIQWWFYSGWFRFMTIMCRISYIREG